MFMIDQRLVCLIPGRESDVARSVPMDQSRAISSTSYQPSLKLVRLWQRLRRDVWVIGAVVQNQSPE